MSIKATKFAFDEEFTTEGRTSGSGRRAAELERLREAEAAGYARGLLDGRRETEQEAAMRMAAAVERVAAAAAAVLAQVDGERARFETEAAALAIVFARKLAGIALDREPLGPIEEAAADCFRQLVGVPHLVARVPSGFVDRVKPVLDRQAQERGFQGRLIVLGDPELGAGDFALEWADGGVSRSTAELDAEITAAIERHVGPLPAGVMKSTG